MYIIDIFELDEQINTKLNIYLKFVVAEGYVVSNTMLIIIKFLPKEYLLYYTLLCDNLHPSSQGQVIPCFMALPNDVLCSD